MSDTRTMTRAEALDLLVDSTPYDSEHQTTWAVDAILRAYEFGKEAAAAAVMAGGESVATVLISVIGDRADITWRGVPNDDAPMLPAGTLLYAAPPSTQALVDALNGLLDCVHEGRLITVNEASLGYTNSVVKTAEAALAAHEGRAEPAQRKEGDGDVQG